MSTDRAALMTERSTSRNFLVFTLLVGTLYLSIIRCGGVYWEWLVLLALADLSQAPGKVKNGLLVFAGAACAWTLALHWVPEALQNYGQLSLFGGGCALLVVALVQALPFALLTVGTQRLGTSSRQRAAMFALMYGVCEAWWPWFAPYSVSVSLTDTFFAVVLAWVGRALFAVLLGLLAATATQMQGGRRFAWFALPLTFPHWPSGEPPSEHTVPGAIVQVPSGASTTADEGFHSYVRHTAQLVQRDQERSLIFWGERASPKRADERWHRSRVEHLISPGTALLFGATVRSPLTGEAHNSVLAVGTCEHCRYDKRLLVPFAENVPRWMSSVLAQRRDTFVPGQAKQRGVKVFGIRAGVAICYEGMFSSTYDSLARWGADFVFNPVSDKWIASASGRRGHRALARLAAAEASLPLVRLVDGGPSEVFSSTGRAIASLSTGSEGSLSVDVPRARNVREKWLLRESLRWMMLVALLVAGVHASHWRRRS